MIRVYPALGAGLAVTVFCALLAAPAFSQSAQDKLCDDFAYVSQQLADLRLGGSDEAEAQKIVAGQYEQDQQVYLQMIPVLSVQVYGWTDAQLKGDVEGDFAKQCKAYKG
jgi:hypothetical protein